MAKKKIIHINQHVIKSNTKNKKSDPPITVKTYNTNDYCQEVIICDGEGNEVAKVVHRPHKPLSCGARVWIETRNEVICLDGKTDS
jgi:hypothetical protein